MSVSSRGDCFRLLFLTPFPPRLDGIDGGARSIAQLLEGLAGRHRIALVCMRADTEPQVDPVLRERLDLIEEVRRPAVEQTFPALARHRARVLLGLLRGKPMWATDWAVAGYGARVRAVAERWQPEIVQIEYHIMGQYLPHLASCPAPRVLVEHEPGAPAADSRTPDRLIGWPRHVVDRQAWRRYERGIFEDVSTVVVFTERDKSALRSLTPSTPVTRIPLGTALPRRPLNPLGEQPETLLFVGNFSHPPNSETASRLIHRILPKIQERFPGLTVHIVGANPPPEIQRAANQSVVVTGHVPDVEPYLDRASLVVVPLQSGGGMRVKVLEALAAGKVVVASRLAVEGLAVVDGEHVALAETDQEFADAIAQLLAHPDRRLAMAGRARAWATENLGWERAVSAYERLYQRLLNGPSPEARRAALDRIYG